jgi:hypothetical protein
MRMSKIIQAVLIGIFFQITMLACAGAGNMKKSMTSDHKMNDMKMEKTDMQDKKMKSDDMKSDMEMHDSMSDTITATLSGSKGHHAAGKISFVKEMGKELLVLSDIKIDKVPDGHVYLAKNGDRHTGIDLGVLKQFEGDTSFALPAGTDLTAYDSVIIYCEQFNVEIGRAKLETAM